MIASKRWDNAVGSRTVGSRTGLLNVMCTRNTKGRSSKAEPPSKHLEWGLSICIPTAGIEVKGSNRFRPPSPILERSHRREHHRLQHGSCHFRWFNPLPSSVALLKPLLSHRLPQDQLGGSPREGQCLQNSLYVAHGVLGFIGEGRIWAER